MPTSLPSERCGYAGLVFAESFDSTELSDAWVEDDDAARWRSGSGHTGAASGSSLLEVPAGCKLPRHTDSAEETIVIVAGTASVTVGDKTATVPAGGVALVPANVTHEVRNAADDPLRFVALYADTDVVTTYERPVQPDGDRQREPLG
jgi:quercetin dioxygenase-like cupin family protein